MERTFHSWDELENVSWRRRLSCKGHVGFGLQENWKKGQCERRDRPGQRLRGGRVCVVSGEFSSLAWLENRVLGRWGVRGRAGTAIGVAVPLALKW